MNVYSQVQLNTTMVNFSNAMGMAERIKSTVFPVTIVISSLFFLLDKVAKDLQDPFENKPTDTAMTTIATNIEINIKQLLSETDIPHPYPRNKFYSL